MAIRPGVPILLGAIFSALISLPVQAQSVQGTVRAEDGAPLAGVQISVRDTTTGVVTDVDGQYLLDHVGAAALTLEYRFVGFRTQVRDVLLMRDEDVLLDVTMLEETLEFGEIIITAEGQEAALLKRSTRSVVVLDAKALGDLQGETLGQMLETLPGVTSLTTGPSISKPVIRGLHSQRVVVLNNGVVQEGAQWGGEHGPEIDPFSPGRIEVIKGAASVEYGIGAIGGVIRAEPEELPYRESISGTIHLNGYSNNRQVAGSSTVQGEPAVDHDFSFDIDAPKQRIDHDLISAKGHIQLSSGDWLEAQYGYQANRRAEFDAHARGNDLDSAPAFSLRLNTHSLDLKLRARPRGSWLGVAGISVMEQSNRNRQTGLLIPNFRSRAGGVFAHGSHVSGPLTLEAGLRLDHRWLQAYPLESRNIGPFVRRTHALTSPSAVPFRSCVPGISTPISPNRHPDIRSSDWKAIPQFPSAASGSKWG
jgi:outer membrane receptor protein involved in Fe transport